MDPKQTTDENLAATVANAAMNGAVSNVTTTDLTASDVAPEPTLQTPVLDMSALNVPATDTTTNAAPILDASALETPTTEPSADTGPVSLAPSSDFQIGEVATVSAVQNGQDGNLASNNEVMIGQPLEQPANLSAIGDPESPLNDPTVDQLANTEMGTTGEEASNFNDPNAQAEADANASAKIKDDDEDDEPIVAAAPVPGSIGSAKSYVDIQRAEAEKAAKVAAKQGKKFNLGKNTILLIAVGVVAVIGIGVGAFVLLNSGGSKPTNTATTTEEPAGNDDLSTLSCKRPLAQEEFASYGAISGTYENIFRFKNDVLDGLATNFGYTYANKALAIVARDNLALQYGVNLDEEDNSNSETEEPSTDENTDSETSGKKTTAEMLKHTVSLEGLTVIHGMEIKSEDIEAWLASDAYSDKTYGAVADGAAAPATDGEESDVDESGEIIRNLKYYNSLQNSIGFTCTTTKGY